MQTLEPDATVWIFAGRVTVVSRQLRIVPLKVQIKNVSSGSVSLQVP